MEPLLLGVVVIVALLLLYYQEHKNKALHEKNQQLAIQNAQNLETLKEFQATLLEVEAQLGEERETNRALLSQKKSSETRLGQISEHLVPFLENCTHDPKQMHFLGNPIDYVVFNFDDGAITFLEVKSGNSKPSKRQKTIKNIIKSGRVFYEEIRISQKGIKNKVVNNLEASDKNSAPTEVSDETSDDPENKN